MAPARAHAAQAACLNFMSQQFGNAPSLSRFQSMFLVSLSPAGPWLRGLAFWIDMLVLSFLTLLISVLACEEFQPVLFQFFSRLGMMEFGTSWELLAVTTVCCAILISWLYHVIFEISKYGATPGKILLGLHVADFHGNRIGILKANLRFWSKCCSLAPLGAGLLMAFFTEQKTAMHDRVSRTLVVREPLPATMSFRAAFAFSTFLSVAYGSFLYYAVWIPTFDLEARQRVLELLNLNGVRPQPVAPSIQNTSPPTSEPASSVPAEKPTPLVSETAGYIIIGKDRTDLNSAFAYWDSIHQTLSIYFFDKKFSQTEAAEVQQRYGQETIAGQQTHKLLVVMRLSSSIELSKESLRSYTIIFPDPKKPLSFGYNYSPAEPFVSALSGGVHKGEHVTLTLRNGKFWNPTRTQFVWSLSANAEVAEIFRRTH